MTDINVNTVPALLGLRRRLRALGIRSALPSGTRDALLYDGLSALGAVDRYPAVLGRAESVAIGANQ
jgi:hypothetical protein